MGKKISILAIPYYYNRIKQINTKRLFREILESIAGTDKDFTTVNLGKAILLLSIPMVLEMLMESVFAVVDIFFISHLGADAIATVGITESLMTIVYAIGFGLSIGTTALISRRIGEKRRGAASEVAFQAIIIGVLVSAFLAVPGIFFAQDILRLMGAGETVVNEMSVYTSIILSSNVVIMLLFIINAVFRSAGDAAISMRVLWFANILNLILDPLLIFGWGPVPELGIKGAAIATTTGRGLAVLFQFYYLFYGKKRIQLNKRSLKIKTPVIWELIKLSLGGIGQNIIATSSWIFMVMIITRFGSIAMAGYTLAIRIVIFALLPSWGISNAAATLVGQNLGAKRSDRAERSVWVTGQVNMVLLGIIGLFFALLPEFFVRIIAFDADYDVISHAAGSLRIVSLGFIAYGLGMVLMQALNGAGDTLTPTIINFVSFWVIEIPLAYLLSLGFGAQGVYYAIVISETSLTIFAYFFFRKGNWKLKKV